MFWYKLLISLCKLYEGPFFTVQLSHPYMTTGKTIAFTRQTFVGKVMSLLFNIYITSTKKLAVLTQSWLSLLSVPCAIFYSCLCIYDSVWKLPVCLFFQFASHFSGWTGSPSSYNSSACHYAHLCT